MGDIIGISGLFRALPADYLAPPTGDRQSRYGTPPTDHKSADVGLAYRVELSDLGSLLSRTIEASGARLGRIANIRAAIDAGTYETPTKIAVVVDRLLEQLKL